MTFPLNLVNNLATAVNVVPDNRDLLNINNDNTIQNARYIDPKTHDYAQSADNHLIGENAIDQQVLLILNTTYNTAFVSSFGQNFASIRMLSGNAAARAQALLLEALSTPISNGDITIMATNFSTDPSGQLNINFTYSNNTTGKTKAINFLPHQ